MGDRSKIEWTDASWTPIRARNLETGKLGHFCIHASEGCRNCYAERLQPRFGNPIRYAAQDRGKVELFLDEDMLMQPLRWRRPRMVFVCSMTDLFGEFVPEEWIDRIFAVMALAHRHTFQVLTKRAMRMHEYMTSIEDGDGRLRDRVGDPKGGWRGALIEGTAQKIEYERTGVDPSMTLAVHLPLPNVWLMVSAENTETWRERVPYLMETPATVRGVSVEPMLGPIDPVIAVAPWSTTDRFGKTRRQRHQEIGNRGYNPLTGEIVWTDGSGEADEEGLDRLDWLIVGGESGPGARPVHPDWARSIREQCNRNGIPLFFKQWGEWAPRPVERTAKPPPGSIVPKKWLYAKRRHQFDDGTSAYWVGKKRAGRLLDGREWNQMPA